MANLTTQIRGYGEIFSYIRDSVANGKKVWLDPDKSNYALIQAAGGSHEDDAGDENKKKGSETLVSKVSPIILMKALKVRKHWYRAESALSLYTRSSVYVSILVYTYTQNPVELDGMRACHLRDGAAEVEFLAWLDKEVQGRSVSEIEIDQVLTKYRSEREKFLGLR